MSGDRLEVVRADITTLHVDAIVNAANETLLGGGGVDGAIHRAAGPALLEACRKLGGCATGDGKLTEGFDLPARWVIHTVGPIWGRHAGREDELLRSCYATSLNVARSCGARSIAFPAISCGVYGFPLERAAPIAVDTVFTEFQRDERFERAVFCCFSDAVAAVVQEALERRRAE